VIKLDDLAPGMELAGTVLNVVDFGAFVDIGLHDTGLVHVSQLANRFVRDPHDVVCVGDIVKVWVHEIDKDRRRVSLSMIPPGSERQQNQRGKSDRGKPKDDNRPRREGGKKEGGRGKRPPKPAQPVVVAPVVPPPPPTIDRTPRPPSRKPAQRFGRTDKKSVHASAPAAQQPAATPPPKPKQKPAFTPHITEKMRQGKEPLRTFGDLMQLITEKKEGDEPTS
jgi:uncharacterized protein